MIKKIMSSINLMLRVLKNLVLRPFRTIRNKVVYFFNAGRLVTKLPGVAKKLPKILKTKPEKREDYFDWGSIYVAKSLVFLVLAVIIIIPIVAVVFLKPLFISLFGVKAFHVDDEALSDYSGRVLVYYDTEFDLLKFEGKLKKGDAVEYGEEYHENGRIAYAGEFVDGVYEGDGISYYEDGTVMYRGEFTDGRFEGQGEYTAENGDIYSGTFTKGKLSGNGTLTQDGAIRYAGAFEDGVMSGEGKLYYRDGTVQYSGIFNAGILEGVGMEYYEDGMLKYYGDFLGGMYHGNGILYSESGSKVYSGEFEKGMYNGSGTLYSQDGAVTVGSFANGAITGIALRTYPNGMTYEGGFEGELPHGNGILSDLLGTFTYRGAFVDGDIDYTSLLLCDTAEVGGYFADKLTMKVASDCFYLCHTGYGITLRCSFADAQMGARVTEVASRIPTASKTVIRSAEDIIAPNAISVAASDLPLPEWASSHYKLSASTLDCYAAEYEKATVYYYVDNINGKLILKTAVYTGEGASLGAGGADLTSDEAVRAEIEEIFSELGLDIRDFAGLGF